MSKGSWTRAKHLSWLSNALADATFGEDRKFLIVSFPPRHGKSQLASFWFPIWFLSHFPQRRVILASYEADFAASWGRKVRDFISTNAEVGLQMTRDSTAANRWDLTTAGGMVTGGIGSALTGRGSSCLIIDDYCKNMEEALSEYHRDRAWDWFTSTAFTRLEPNGMACILATRWHEEDLIGKILKSETAHLWNYVRFPAIAEENDVLGRSIGDALWPERYDVEALARIRSQVGSLVWNGLYQQRPAPPEGNLIKKAHFNFWRELPDDIAYIVLSWDLTFSATGSSYFVGQAWAQTHSNPQRKYLIDQIRARGDFVKQIYAIKTMARRWPEANELAIEEKANGAAAIATLRDEIRSPPIVGISPRGSKEARVASILPEFESGNIWIPDPSICSWVDDYIGELISFPNAENDDQVDTTSQAISRLKLALPNSEPMSLKSIIRKIGTSL